MYVNNTTANKEERTEAPIVQNTFFYEPKKKGIGRKGRNGRWG